MQGMLRDWPMPVVMIGAVLAKRGGSENKGKVKTITKSMKMWKYFKATGGFRVGTTVSEIHILYGITKSIPSPVTIILATALMVPNWFLASQMYRPSSSSQTPAV